MYGAHTSAARRSTVATVTDGGASPAALSPPSLLVTGRPARIDTPSFSLAGSTAILNALSHDGFLIAGPFLMPLSAMYSLKAAVLWMLWPHCCVVSPSPQVTVTS